METLEKIELPPNVEDLVGHEKLTLLEAFIALLPVLSKDLDQYAGLIRFGGGTLILAGLMISLWITKERRKRYVLGTST